MIEAKKIYEDVVTLQAAPDLIMHIDENQVDALIEKLNELKESSNG